MKIYMDESVEKFIFNTNNNYDLYEVAFLSIARRKDTDFEVFEIFKYYIDGNDKDSVKIPKIDQLSLIKYCISNEVFPVLIHTHIGSKYKLEFSYGDLIFEKSFAQACSILNYNKFILCILYGKEGYTAKVYINNRYFFLNIIHSNLIKCVNKNIIRKIIDSIEVIMMYPLKKKI